MELNKKLWFLSVISYPNLYTLLAPERFAFAMKVWNKLDLLSSQYPVSVEFNNSTAKVIVIQDLSELKVFERKILYFKKAIEQSSASIVITDLNGDIEYVNPAFTEKTGYSFEEVVGKNPRILKNESKPSDEYKPMWDDLLSGKTWRGEFYNTKKNGDHYWQCH